MHPPEKFFFSGRRMEQSPGGVEPPTFRVGIERATHCATEKRPCLLAPKILFYSSLYNVQFASLDLQHCKEG